MSWLHAMHLTQNTGHPQQLWVRVRTSSMKWMFSRYVHHLYILFWTCHCRQPTPCCVVSTLARFVGNICHPKHNLILIPLQKYEDKKWSHQTKPPTPPPTPPPPHTLSLRMMQFNLIAVTFHSRNFYPDNLGQLVFCNQQYFDPTSIKLIWPKHTTNQPKSIYLVIISFLIVSFCTNQIDHMSNKYLFPS